jgi:hypothetical protein
LQSTSNKDGWPPGVLNLPMHNAWDTGSRCSSGVRTVVDALNKEIKVFLNGDDIKKNIATLGAGTDYGTPQQYSDFVAAEAEKFAAIIKQEGLQMM